jgi:homocitrate synthase NifV
VDAAARTGVDGLHISLPGSASHLKNLGQTQSWVLDRMASMVEYGRRSFTFISVGLQDASRGEEAFLLRAAAVAAELRVNRLRLADSIGVWNPFQVQAMITKLRQWKPELSLGFHAHNDLGMATANTLAARVAGASSVDVTVNGLGERAGNAPLEEVVMAMHVSLDECCGIDLRQLRKLAVLVARASRRAIPESKPITGRAAFRHEAGIHVHGWLRDRSSYEAFTPESVGGRGSSIVIGKHSGRATLRYALEAQGVEVTDTQLSSLLTLVRSNAESRKRPLTLRQLVALAREVG